MVLNLFFVGLLSVLLVVVGIQARRNCLVEELNLPHVVVKEFDFSTFSVFCQKLLAKSCNTFLRFGAGLHHLF